MIYLAFSEVATDFSRHVIKQSRVEVDSVNIMVVQPGTEYMLYERDVGGPPGEGQGKEDDNPCIIMHSFWLGKNHEYALFLEELWVVTYQRNEENQQLMNLILLF